MVEPYYQDDAVTIYHGDCREIAPRLGCDFALVSDPPYGMNWNPDSTRFTGGTFGRQRGTGRDDWLRVRGDKDPFDPSEWVDFPAVVLWGLNHFAARVPVGTWLVWQKKPPKRYGTFLSDAEVAWRKGGHGIYLRHVPWEGGMHKRGENAPAHPTQKPVEIMEWAIDRCGDTERTILDPFMGSGTTLVAAKNLGRKAIGIEIEERYCEVAAQRCSQGVLAL